MGRKRRHKNRGLPAYLYRNNGGSSFIYKRPGFDPMGMGTDESVAIRAAEEINRRFESPDVLSLVTRFDGRPVKDQAKGVVLFAEFSAKWLEHYIIEERPAKATLEKVRQRLNRLNKNLGERTIETITTADCAHVMSQESRSEYPKMRFVLTAIFTYAKEQGVFPSIQPNPAAETGTRRLKAKERERMTWLQFWGIYDAGCLVVKRAMMIVLQTTLRRADVCALRLDNKSPSHFLRDNELFVIPEKSNTNRRKNGPARLKWDLSVQKELGDIIREARETSMQHGRCPFVLHEIPKRITKQAKEAKEHYCQVLPARLTNLFEEARTRAMEADPTLFEGYTAAQLPGIHEVRALASYEYEQQGAPIEQVQDLMAHTNERTTRAYQAGHEPDEWKKITLRLRVERQMVG